MQRGSDAVVPRIKEFVAQGVAILKEQGIDLRNSSNKAYVDARIEKGNFSTNEENGYVFRLATMGVVNNVYSIELTMLGTQADNIANNRWFKRIILARNVGEGIQILQWNTQFELPSGVIEDFAQATFWEGGDDLSIRVMEQTCAQVDWAWSMTIMGNPTPYVSTVGPI